jgi:hypothetical protein
MAEYATRLAVLIRSAVLEKYQFATHRYDGIERTIEMADKRCRDDV